MIQIQAFHRTCCLFVLDFGKRRLLHRLRYTSLISVFNPIQSNPRLFQTTRSITHTTATVIKARKNEELCTTEKDRRNASVYCGKSVTKTFKIYGRWLVDSPGGSTVQWGAGRGLLVVVLSAITGAMNGANNCCYF